MICFIILWAITWGRDSFTFSCAVRNVIFHILFSVISIHHVLCVLRQQTHWVLNQFPLLTPAVMKHCGHEFRGHCFAWCHPSAQRFLPTGSTTTPPVLEHGDFTLLLCKACFSVCVCACVWQTHGYLWGEVTEDTQKRCALVCNSENILLSLRDSSYIKLVMCKHDCKIFIFLWIDYTPVWSNLFDRLYTSMCIYVCRLYCCHFKLYTVCFNVV